MRIKAIACAAGAGYASKDGIVNVQNTALINTATGRHLMAEHSTSDFDFDDWAGLYIENPQEFEARRSAALMIEMARGTPEQCAAGRALLEAYEKRVKGCSPQERMKVASSMMAESASQLSTELQVLKTTLENLEEQPEEI